MLRPLKNGALSMTWDCTASQKAKVESKLTGDGRDEFRILQTEN
jgi:hypothetical protein